MCNSETQKQGKVGSNKCEVIRRLPAACRDEAEAVAFFEWLRWPNGAGCPRCGDTDVRMMRSKDGGRNKRFLWACRGCKRQFTVRIGTVMEDSPIPMTTWAYAFWALCAGKKGCSSKQIERMTGLSYKSALFLTHRVRWAMADDRNRVAQLAGVLEADETYVGGKPRYPIGHPKRTAYRMKTPVLGVVQRDGEVRASVKQAVTADNIRAMISGNAKRGSLIITDEHRLYGFAVPGVGMKHEVVTHWTREYVRRDDRTIHTQTIESFWATLKRGLIGSYHAVSPEHLHRYVSEFEYRWNTRKLKDGERIAQAIRQADGRRLCYVEPDTGEAA